MRRLFMRWDMLAALQDVGAPAVPIDPDALSQVERLVLLEWIDERVEALKAAKDKAAKA